jgi:hypothetical protein
MISDKQVAHIRHLFHAEHWKMGTIAAELHLHPDTVRAAGFGHIQAWDAALFYRGQPRLPAGCRTFYLARKQFPPS